MVHFKEDWMKKRERFLQAVRENIGIPYIYGGQSRKGADCSGFVVLCARQAGIRMPDRSAAAMVGEYFHDFKKMPGLAEPGDLLFYGKTAMAITHVMVVIERWADGTLITAGARGGDSTTKTVKKAKQNKAFVDVCMDYWPERLQMAVNPFGRWGE